MLKDGNINVIEIFKKYPDLMTSRSLYETIIPNYEKKDASYGKMEIIKYLINHDIHKPKNGDDSPVVCAASIGNYEALKLLLENGADPNENEIVGDSIRLTAMERVCQLKTFHPEIYQPIRNLLTSYGAKTTPRAFIIS